MARKTYQIYCTFCNYKKITDGTDVSCLKEIPRARILKGSVSQNKNFSFERSQEPTEEYLQKTLKQAKQFKCPQCGFAIKAKEISSPETPTDE